jgi:hypothetical protein
MVVVTPDRGAWLNLKNPPKKTAKNQKIFSFFSIEMRPYLMGSPGPRRALMGLVPPPSYLSK